MFFFLSFSERWRCLFFGLFGGHFCVSGLPHPWRSSPRRKASHLFRWRIATVCRPSKPGFISQQGPKNSCAKTQQVRGVLADGLPIGPWERLPAATNEIWRVGLGAFVAPLWQVSHLVLVSTEREIETDISSHHAIILRFFWWDQSLMFFNTAVSKPRSGPRPPDHWDLPIWLQEGTTAPEASWRKVKHLQWWICCFTCLIGHVWCEQIESQKKNCKRDCTEFEIWFLSTSWLLIKMVQRPQWLWDRLWYRHQRWFALSQEMKLSSNSSWLTVSRTSNTGDILATCWWLLNWPSSSIRTPTIFPRHIQLSWVFPSRSSLLRHLFKARVGSNGHRPASECSTSTQLGDLQPIPQG